MEKPPTYRIETVADFMALPEECIDACLDEFRTFLRIAGPMLDMLGRDDVEFVPAFQWIDDGVKHVRVVLKSGEGR